MSTELILNPELKQAIALTKLERTALEAPDGGKEHEHGVNAS